MIRRREKFYDRSAQSGAIRGCGGAFAEREGDTARFRFLLAIFIGLMVNFL